VATAAAKLGQVEAQRSAAANRVEELEREQAAAYEAVRAAASAIAEHERQGGRPAEREKLEMALASAREKSQDPALAARIEGARSRVRDLDGERQRFIAGNLTELVEAVEARGAIAAGNLTAAAEALVAAFHERESAAAAIFSLAGQVGGRTEPGDVSRTRAEVVVREASRLLGQGGELAPRLLRDPRHPTAPAEVEAETDADVVADPVAIA
jgi:hypothetical protein